MKINSLGDVQMHEENCKCTSQFKMEWGQ